MDLSRPGKPPHNGFIEAFAGRLLQESHRTRISDRSVSGEQINMVDEWHLLASDVSEGGNS